MIGSLKKCSLYFDPNLRTSDRYGVSNERIFEFIRFREKVLDVGCGTGLAGELLNRKKCQVIGIECDEESVREAEKRLDKVYHGHAEDLIDRLPYDGFFDVILCGDVLEHMVRPDEFLHRSAKLLAHDGRVIASIPNIANYYVRYSLIRGRFDYQDAGLLDKSHLRFFTLKSILAMFSSAGYDVLSVSHTESPPRGMLGVPSLIHKFLKLFFPRWAAYQYIIVATPSK